MDLSSFQIIWLEICFMKRLETIETRFKPLLASRFTFRGFWLSSGRRGTRPSCFRQAGYNIEAMLFGWKMLLCQAFSINVDNIWRNVIKSIPLFAESLPERDTEAYITTSSRIWRFAWWVYWNSLVQGRIIMLRCACHKSSYSSGWHLVSVIPLGR